MYNERERAGTGGEPLYTVSEDIKLFGITQSTAAKICFAGGSRERPKVIHVSGGPDSKADPIDLQRAG
jgi:hypothetical protein